MTPEAQGATAEGFTRGEHRPTVRGEARPEDWNEAPRRRASEHSRERPEGEGVKPHSRKLPDPPTASQLKNPPFRTLSNIPRGERGEQSAPLGGASTSGPLPEKSPPRQPAQQREGLPLRNPVS